jgi:hypothetical protein
MGLLTKPRVFRHQFGQGLRKSALGQSQFPLGCPELRHIYTFHFEAIVRAISFKHEDEFSDDST